MEFGSDFHSIVNNNKNITGGKNLYEIFPNSKLYALGRHALEEIINKENIQTLWLPSYYCYDLIDSICPTKKKINIKYYNTTPLMPVYESIKNLNIKPSDGIVLMNFFGLWGGENTPDLDCLIIEDHSHDLLSTWALNSKADYCFASLRKTIPLAEGGMVWSNKKIIDLIIPVDSEFHKENAFRRTNAMRLKKDFLNGININKEDFLREFQETEENFKKLKTSPLNQHDVEFIQNFDLKDWYKRKRNNWKSLYSICKNLKNCQIIDYRNLSSCNSVNTPFSLILEFKNPDIRNKVRKELINNSIYPAILWSIPEKADEKSKDFGKTMLSIHCDGRYDEDSIILLGQKLTEIVNSI